MNSNTQSQSKIQRASNQEGDKKPNPERFADFTLTRDETGFTIRAAVMYFTLINMVDGSMSLIITIMLMANPVHHLNIQAKKTRTFLMTKKIQLTIWPESTIWTVTTTTKRNTSPTDTTISMLMLKTTEDLAFTSQISQLIWKLKI